MHALMAAPLVILYHTHCNIVAHKLGRMASLADLYEVEEQLTELARTLDGLEIRLEALEVRMERLTAVLMARLAYLDQMPPQPTRPPPMPPMEPPPPGGSTYFHITPLTRVVPRS